MYFFQVVELFTEVLHYATALDTLLLLITALLYHPKSLAHRGKMLLVLMLSLLFVSCLMLMFLHPLFAALYVLTLYPAYALWRGDAAGRIIMGLYYVLGAAAWFGVFIVVRLGIVMGGGDDYTVWLSYVVALLVSVGSFTSAMLLFFAKSIRVFQQQCRG